MRPAVRAIQSFVCGNAAAPAALDKPGVIFAPAKLRGLWIANPISGTIFLASLLAFQRRRLKAKRWEAIDARVSQNELSLIQFPSN